MFILGLILLLGLVSQAWADNSGTIVTDGSMGNQQMLSGQRVAIDQSLGTVLGSNLFHSFSSFNINTGQTVTFTGDSVLQHVISRVTGGTSSSIDGTLRSTIGKADFYLINPAGITFGAQAVIDVPAAFHASTADQLQFADGQVFSATLNQNSQLSSAEPAAFGFLGTSTVTNGLITVDKSKLAVKSEQALDLVAGNISVTVDETRDGATLKAEAGQLRLVAMQNAGRIELAHGPKSVLPLPEQTPSADNAGKIQISEPILVGKHEGDLDTSGNGGGRIVIWGDDIALNHITAYDDNTGSKSATLNKGVDIRGRIVSIDNSWISFDTLQAGKAGPVTVSAIDTMTISNAANIKSFAFGTGNAGNVSFSAGKLDIINGASVSSASYAQGNAGNVTVAADALRIDSQGNTRSATGVISRSNPGSSGRTGKVTVSANALEIVNGGRISTSTFTQGSAGRVEVTAGRLLIDSQGFTAGATSIFSRAEQDSRGRAGDVSVQATTMDVINSGDISSSTAGLGNAGNVTIQTNLLNLLNGGAVSSYTADQGNAGVVNVVANDLSIDSQSNATTATGIFSRATVDSSGYAGNVSVDAGRMTIVNGGNISSSTFGQGDAGDIQISADKLTIDAMGNQTRATGINSQANQGSGNASNVLIQAKQMELIAGGVVSSSTFSAGNAGNVLVNAQELIIDGRANTDVATGIFSRANQSSMGHAGDVEVIAGNVGIFNSGSLSSSTFGQGHAGNIVVQADRVMIDNSSGDSQVTGIFSEAKPGSSGQVGNISLLLTNRLDLFHGAKISIENAGIVENPALITPGLISVSAADINLQESSMTTRSTGNIAAGDVRMQFRHQLTLDPSFISTTANTGNGGRIDILGGELISLKQSGFTTSVAGSNSNGGDIAVTADALVMDNGVIQANAVGGAGGDIRLNLKMLIPSANQLILGGAPVIWQPYEPNLNLIQAASEAGVSGTVSVTAPQLNLSGLLVNLGGPQYDQQLVSQDYCDVGEGSTLVRMGAGGLKMRSSDQSLFGDCEILKDPNLLARCRYAPQ